MKRSLRNPISSIPFIHVIFLTCIFVIHSTSYAKPPRKPAARRPAADPAALDPFGLTAVFAERWDMTAMVADASDALRYRAQSARLRLRRLSAGLETLSASATRRQANVANAARALYLLGRAESDASNAALGDIDDAAGSALRAMVSRAARRDAAALSAETAAWTALRDAEDAAWRRLRRLETRPVPAAAPDAATAPDLPALEAILRDIAADDAGAPSPVTRSVADTHHRATDALLAERAAIDPAARAAFAAVAAARERLSRPRQTIASLALPPPDAPPEPPTAVAPGGAFALPAPFNSTGPADPAGPRDEEAPAPRPEAPSKPAERPGIVVAAAPGSTVLCAADGTIAFANTLRGSGEMVVVEHPGGFFSLYQHLETLRVGEGQAVRRGQPLGVSGTVPGPDKPAGFRFQVRLGKEPVPAARLLGTLDPAAALVGR